MDLSRRRWLRGGAERPAATPSAVAAAAEMPASVAVPASAPAPGPARVAVPQPGCLALRGVACRLCGEACEPRALRFRPRLGGAPLPVVIDADCTGCGECVPLCPSQAIALVPRPPVSA